MVSESQERPPRDRNIFHPSSSDTLLATSATAKRLHQLQQEQAALQQQLRVQQYANDYNTQFAFPAVVTWSKSSPTQWTDPLLVQHRLLDSKVLFEVPVTVGDQVQSIDQFVKNLEATGCFRSVRVELGGTPLPSNDDDDAENPGNQNTPPRQRLTVVLDEAKWYNLYIGGGLKQHQFQQQGGGGGLPIFANNSTTDTSSFLPTAEFEARLGLRNLAGCSDTTQFQYSLDTHNIATWNIQHDRPLYSILSSALQDLLLEEISGSNYMLQGKLVWDTLDFQTTRSYQEYQRLLSIGISHAGEGRLQQTPAALSAVWHLLFRDVVPRRHASLPYHFMASPQVVALSGPSVKNSVTFTVSGTFDTSTEVSSSCDYKVQSEIAFPPGDVGFAKSQVNVGWHIPFFKNSTTIVSPDQLQQPDNPPPELFSFHLLGAFGILASMNFGGLTQPAGLSDRFLLGGPVQFRGFSAAGIGPRAGISDALGGDFMYQVTGLLSTPLPQLSPDISAFAFGQVGTCAHCLQSLRKGGISPLDVLQSSRVSVGVGLATNLLGPRLELTYALPLRYGPLDNRRNFQLGIGMSMGG